ncbi:GntR family transcriptional regulator [Paraburkholderia sp. GAS42]|uniref:GntR family transcriptional regulator n=1 Tax=Paraburkholderia sp. GAS42 TaxID=3035135 RepID=UPI003D22DFEA
MNKAVRVVERHAAPLRQQVVKLLREDILDGQIAPGERLVEGALCTTYDVSRTVVREALRQLESEHLVTVLPNGPVVTVLTKRDIESIYQVRATLEGLAGELFASNAPEDDVAAMVALRDRMEEEYVNGTVEQREEIKEEFYSLLLKGGGNDVLAESMSVIHARIALFRRYAFVDGKRVALSMKELRRIIDAAAVRRDPERARRACEEHIQGASKLAVEEYSRRLAEIDAANTAITPPAETPKRPTRREVVA